MGVNRCNTVSPCQIATTAILLLLVQWLARIGRAASTATHSLTVCGLCICH